ncbi:hypothetical protein K501DRAFT_231185 [Backusella circina FSU 941]|nr:hypothetical protein K501DRAFT_231185 [Backusella circina FSU 941]
MEKTSKLTVEELRQALEGLGLDSRGRKPELKLRLKKAQKKQSEPKEAIPATPPPPQQQQQAFDYFLFFDVEATCIKDGGFNYANEIIEFPVVLISGTTFEVVDEFRSYVKPGINPVLSEYCIELTGITQDIVDKSPDFVEVLNAFQVFMEKYDLFRSKTATFVTDGPYDIRDFITKQCKHSNLASRPSYFDIPWVNIRKTFRQFYNLKTHHNISAMLYFLDMEFTGREHSGLDDARNLAAIGKRMHEDGCVFKTNCKWNYKSGDGRRKR